MVAFESPDTPDNTDVSFHLLVAPVQPHEAHHAWCLPYNRMKLVHLASASGLIAHSVSGLEGMM